MNTHQNITSANQNASHACRHAARQCFPRRPPHPNPSQQIWVINTATIQSVKYWINKRCNNNHNNARWLCFLIRQQRYRNRFDRHRWLMISQERSLLVSLFSFFFLVLFAADFVGVVWRDNCESYLFQCCLVLYKAGKVRGSIVLTLSLIKLRMYSLFQ